MPTAERTCPGCGNPIEVRIPDVFADAGIVGALCPACTDRQFLDGGGMVLALRREPGGGSRQVQTRYGII